MKARRARGEGTTSRRPEVTRGRILDAATREFSSRGLGGARVDAIATRAGVNKRMLYHYFGNKEALFRAVLENAYEDIRRREEALDLTHLPPEAALRELVTFTFDYFLINPHFIALLNSENLHRARHIRRSGRVGAINNPIVRTLAEVLARGEKAGVFRSGIEPIQLYISIAGVSYFYFSNVHTLSTIFARDLRAPAALKERAAHVVDLMLRAVRP
ncbi:MAG: TetR family transcriptional regulator [Alphaproteobacteria bacterium]|nr:TetR family transcriptional regulator [Alphaproteobacteria bacterium]